MKLRNRESMIVLGGFLGSIALMAALILGLVSQWTSEPIKQSHEKNRQVVFHRLLLPEFDSTGNEIHVGVFAFTPVLNKGDIAGYVGQGVSRNGYGGAIEALVGFDNNGKITAVQILRHKETPGLGANVCDRKFQRTVLNLSEKAPDIPQNRMLDQYAGMHSSQAGKWRISKDGGKFHYLTGATVTSRAVTALINDIAVAFAGSILSQDEGENE